MQTSGTKLLDVLGEIKGKGSFMTAQSVPFTFPRLTIPTLGEIAFPVNELQAKALIQEAHKAPFGKGSQTIIDNSVRSAWEIDSEKLHFMGNEWNRFVQGIVSTIQSELGIEEFEVEAHLYKMLIYEKGDFFLTHRDSEKEKGMFGTLIIGLPSHHRGGELLIRFDGVEESVHFEEAANDYRISYAAFYADCEHEVKPLTAGYRVCLVYNLVQKKIDRKIQLEPLSGYASRLSEILKKGALEGEFSPGIVLLGHQYTPDNFSPEHLKPMPPKDWSRPIPETQHDAWLWNILSGFLKSPTEEVFDFRRNQKERDTLESAIGRVTIDLRTVTIKKGSPHTLRIEVWMIETINADALKKTADIPRRRLTLIFFSSYSL